MTLQSLTKWDWFWIGMFCQVIISKLLDGDVTKALIGLIVLLGFTYFNIWWNSKNKDKWY